MDFVWSKVGGSKPRRRPLWWTLCGLRLVVLNPGRRPVDFDGRRELYWSCRESQCQAAAER